MKLKNFKNSIKEIICDKSHFEYDGPQNHVVFWKYW